MDLKDIKTLDIEDIRLSLYPTPLDIDIKDIKGDFFNRFDLDLSNPYIRALIKSEYRFRSIMENRGAVIFLFDTQGCVMYVNPAFTKLTGYTVDEIYQNPDLNYIHPDFKKSICTLKKSLFAGEIDLIPDQEYRIITKNGDIKWVAGIWKKYFDDKDQFAGFEAREMDITSRKKTEFALKESEENFRTVANAAPIMIWVLDKKMKYTFLNNSWVKFAGVSLKNDDIFSYIHPEDKENVTSEYQKSFLTKTGFKLEYRMKNCYGKYRWVICEGVPRLDESNNLDSFIGSMLDITEQKLSQEQLHFEANYDSLTGLPNRKNFLTVLESLIEKSKSDPESKFAIVFLDIDRFKIINDSLGHHIGDKLLIKIAKRILSEIGYRGMVCRLGGDEFTIVLENIQNIKRVTKIVERVQKKLRQLIKLQSHKIYITSSAGITIVEHSSRDAVAILRDADTAMYRAKNTGKDKFEVFDESMHSIALSTMQMESELRKALEKQEFRVFFQPIFSAKDKSLVGMEALLRWIHPLKGIILPSEFLNLARDVGIITDIDKYILKKVCSQIFDWQRAGKKPVKVSINMSFDHLNNKFINEMLLRSLRESGIDGSLLELEFTENVLMNNPIETIKILQEIKKEGISLAIDDFGTGYSSLAYLKNLPIDTLKIDQSFIQDINKNPKSEAIIAAIIALAKNLELKVTAEGVENEYQYQFVENYGVDNIQGYLVGKPTEADQAMYFLK